MTTSRFLVSFILALSHYFAQGYCDNLNYDDLFDNGLDNHIERAREAFETTYYHFVERGLFPVSYNNNLVINPDLHPNVSNEGAIILRLVDWLSKQSDKDCGLLLERVSNLYCLEFQRALAVMDLKNKSSIQLLNAWQSLYRHRATRSYGSMTLKTYPFRALLAKMYVITLVINESAVHYESRKETLLYLLDAVKSEMLEINNDLGPDKINEETIRHFATLVAVYGVREPIVETHTLRKVFLITVAVIACGLFVYYVLLPNKEKIKGWLKSFGNELGINVFEPIGQGLYTGMRKAAEPDIAAAKANMDKHLDTVNQHVETVSGFMNNEIREVREIIKTAVAVVDRDGPKIVNSVERAVNTTEEAVSMMREELPKVTATVSQATQLISERMPEIIELAEQAGATVEQAVQTINQEIPKIVQTVNEGVGVVSEELPRFRQEVSNTVTLMNQELPKIRGVVEQAGITIDRTSQLVANEVSKIEGAIKGESQAWLQEVGKAGNEIAKTRHSLNKRVDRICNKVDALTDEDATKRRTQELTRSLVHALAHDEKGDPNPDVAMLGNQFISGILTEQPHQAQEANTQKQTNPDLTRAAHDIGDNARNGLAQNAGWLGRHLIGSGSQSGGVHQQEKQVDKNPVDSDQNDSEDDHKRRGGWFNWNG